MNMHMILSYAKSHIYDIHALIVGTVIFVLVLLWKRSIDKMITDRLDKHYGDGDEARKKSAFRRTWGLIYVLIFLLAFVFFCAAAAISPFVNNSVPASIISATFAITELELYQSFIQKNR